MDCSFVNCEERIIWLPNATNSATSSPLICKRLARKEVSNGYKVYRDFFYFFISHITRSPLLSFIASLDIHIYIIYRTIDEFTLLENEITRWLVNRQTIIRLVDDVIRETMTMCLLAKQRYERNNVVTMNYERRVI